MRRDVVLPSVAIVVLLTVLVGSATWFWKESRRDEDAIARLEAIVAATPTGGRVDLATAFDLPWDRAVLMEPYSDGATMNERLGFAWYPASAHSQWHDYADFVVFVRDGTVTAQAYLFPDESFGFGERINSFTRDESTFVVVRTPHRVELVRPSGGAVSLEDAATG